MDLTALPASALPSATQALPAISAATAGDPAAARKTAEDFESFFLSQTFEAMFAGTGTDTMFGGGQGETVFRSMLLQEFSKVAVKSGGIGIADAVQREIIRMQGA